MEIYERIKLKMKEKKISQSSLSKTCNIAKSSMSGYINGKNIPSPNTIGLIAKALDTTTDYLIYGKNDLDEDFDKDLNIIIETYKRLDLKNKKHAVEDIKYLLRKQKIENM